LFNPHSTCGGLVLVQYAFTVHAKILEHEVLHPKREPAVPIPTITGTPQKAQHLKPRQVSCTGAECVLIEALASISPGTTASVAPTTTFSSGSSAASTGASPSCSLL